MGEVAHTDAHARTLIPQMQAQLAEAERERDAATDEATRRTWDEAAHHLKEGLDRLRFGPFAPTPDTGQGG